MTTNNVVPSDTVPSRKPRIVHSKASWRNLVSQYEAGSLTQKSFCQQHQISIGSFHKWRYRFKQDDNASHFIDISKAIDPRHHTSESAVDQESPVWQVELELGQGIILRVRSI